MKLVRCGTLFHMSLHFPKLSQSTIIPPTYPSGAPVKGRQFLSLVNLPLQRKTFFSLSLSLTRSHYPREVTTWGLLPQAHLLLTFSSRCKTSKAYFAFSFSYHTVSCFSTTRHVKVKYIHCVRRQKKGQLKTHLKGLRQNCFVFCND